MAEQKNIFQFELVSPERLLMAAEAVGVLVPGSEGDFKVLANHSPVMTTLRPGVIKVDQGEGKEETRIFVRGGFAEVTSGSLVILAEEAMPVKDLSKTDIQSRIKDAEEDLEDAQSDEDRRKAQEAIGQLSELLRALN